VFGFVNNAGISQLSLAVDTLMAQLVAGLRKAPRRGELTVLSAVSFCRIKAKHPDNLR